MLRFADEIGKRYGKIWFGGGSPRSEPSSQILLLWLQCKNVGLQPSQSRKMVIFGINLPLRENYGGPQQKLNIDAQLQTFLHTITP